ncbi:hypothetical protein LguiB_028524 [Lonicera macranthoides]
MSSSGVEPESPDLVCELDNVQGVVDALTSVRWKRHQEIVVVLAGRHKWLNLDHFFAANSALGFNLNVLELSEHGIVLIVEDTGCLQAKVYLKRELFVRYEYGAQGRPRFGVSLGLFVDCLNTFSVPGHSSTIELRYPGPDMQLLLKSVDSLDACIYAEIRTRIPDTISWDYNFEPAGSTPLSFTVKSAALKEAIDDLEWPGSGIQIILQPVPPSVTFKGEGHELDSPIKLGEEMLNKRGEEEEEVFKSVNIGIERSHVDSSGYQQPSRIAYIEFFVKPEVEEDDENDS